MTLYDRIEALCKQHNTNITRMCTQSGASRGSLTDLKKGRKQFLSTETLLKIASYFGVSIDVLLGPPKDPRPLSDDEIQFALFGGKVSDEAYEDVKKFAAYVKEKYSPKT